jgi:hypothetical protein
MILPNPILNSILNSILVKLLIFLSFILYRIEDRVNVDKVDGKYAYIDFKKSIYATGGRLDFYELDLDPR